MSWYTVYRPRHFHDLHLETVRSALVQLLDADSFPQVLLFAGPKGTGKTSSARIVAALLNDPANAERVEYLFFGKGKPKQAALLEPNQNDELVQRIQTGRSFVVTELDAASNRGIDDVRQLKERLALPPQEGKIAVYILDEAHMLTTEAFNALLKVFEEPPPHVVFVLATTEVHKIPDTITSRALLVPFSKASVQEVCQALQTVVDQEKLDSDEAALVAIAEAADGSFRDAVKLLESIARTEKKITADTVGKYLFAGIEGLADQILQAVLSKNPEQVVSCFQKARSEGINESFLTKLFFSYLHDQLLVGLGIKSGTPSAKPEAVHFLLNELSNLPLNQAAPVPFLALEMKLLEIVFRAQKKSGNTSGDSSSSASKTVSGQAKQEVRQVKVSARPVEPIIPTETIVDAQPVTSVPETIELDTVALSSGDPEKILSEWDVLLDAVRAQNTTVGAVLRSARPLSASENLAKIEVYYQFHRDQLLQPKIRDIINRCIVEVAGGPVELEYIVTKPPEKKEDTLEELAKQNLV